VRRIHNRVHAPELPDPQRELQNPLELPRNAFLSVRLKLLKELLHYFQAFNLVNFGSGCFGLRRRNYPNSKETSATHKMPGKGTQMSKSRTGEPYHGATKTQGDRIFNELKKKMVENERTVAALTSELHRLTGGDSVP